MGCFTWTFADKKVEKRKSGWGYKNSCILKHGQVGFIALPLGFTYSDAVINNEGRSFLAETYYGSYGMFGNHDAYDVVVDLNK